MKVGQGSRSGITSSPAVEETFAHAAKYFVVHCLASVDDLRVEAGYLGKFGDTHASTIVTNPLPPSAAWKVTLFMNPEATKHELDKWSEDLLIRIQLRIMHPHIVIHQNGVATDEEEHALEADK